MANETTPRTARQALARRSRAGRRAGRSQKTNRDAAHLRRRQGHTRSITLREETP
jgi:hypothetical protein